MNEPFDWVAYHKELADRISEAIQADEQEWAEKWMINYKPQASEIAE